MTRGRGQTLVLMVVCSLCIVVLATMTLALAARVRSRIELQVVADAAAYSNAVATARTFNSIALLNRAQISHLVAMSGVQSLISWSSMHRSALNGVRYGLTQHPQNLAAYYRGLLRVPRYRRCASKALREVLEWDERLAGEDARIDSSWGYLDTQAARQAAALTDLGIGAEQAALLESLKRQLVDQLLAKRIADIASATSTLGAITAPPSPGRANVREVSLPENGPIDDLVHAAMGSRGERFVTARRGGADPIWRSLSRFNPPTGTLQVVDEGSAYWSDTLSHGRSASGRYAWADDHGKVVVTHVPDEPCPRPPDVCTMLSLSDDENGGGAGAFVKATDLADRTDRHRWFGADEAVAPVRHSTGRCRDCPSIWPILVSYDTGRVDDERDAFGQPKNHVLLERAPTPMIWDLAFRWGNASFATVPAQKQLALATGIAYYHRADHWAEPPNLLNPFWRATLVSFDVDAQGKPDVAAAIAGARHADAAGALDALCASGFQGWQ